MPVMLALTERRTPRDSSLPVDVTKQEWGVVGLKYGERARRAVDVGGGAEESSAGGRQEPTYVLRDT